MRVLTRTKCSCSGDHLLIGYLPRNFQPNRSNFLIHCHTHTHIHTHTHVHVGIRVDKIVRWLITPVTTHVMMFVRTCKAVGKMFQKTIIYKEPVCNARFPSISTITYLCYQNCLLYSATQPRTLFALYCQAQLQLQLFFQLPHPPTHPLTHPPIQKSMG